MPWSPAVLPSPVNDAAPTGQLTGRDFLGGATAPLMRPMLGGPRGGFHYSPDAAPDAPAQADTLVLAVGHAGFRHAVGYTASADPRAGVALPALASPGDSGIFHKSGNQLVLTAGGVAITGPLRAGATSVASLASSGGLNGASGGVTGAWSAGSLSAGATTLGGTTVSGLTIGAGGPTLSNSGGTISSGGAALSVGNLTAGALSAGAATVSSLTLGAGGPQLTNADGTITSTAPVSVGNLTCGTLSTGGQPLTCGGLTCTTINTQGNAVTAGAVTASGLLTANAGLNTSGIVALSGVADAKSSHADGFTVAKLYVNAGGVILGANPIDCASNRLVLANVTTFGSGTTLSTQSLGVTIDGVNYWIQLYT